MKKILSLLLSLSVCLTCFVPAFAVTQPVQTTDFPLFVLNPSDGIWSVRIDPTDIDSTWSTEDNFTSSNTDLEITRDPDGIIVFSTPEDRFSPGKTIYCLIYNVDSTSGSRYVYLNFSTDSKPQFSSRSAAQGYGFRDPEQYSIAAPLCSDWAAEDIAAALKLGFVPNSLQREYTRPVTREEFAYIAMEFCALQTRNTTISELPMLTYLSYEEPFPEPDWLDLDADRFDDCGDSTVRDARRIKLVNGVGDNRFEPNREITRGEAATMLLNAYRVYTGDMYGENSTLLADVPELTYADAGTIEDWAQAPVALMTQWGVMKGVEDNKFDPDGFYTCEQCIVTFMRMWRDAPVSRGNTEGEDPAPFTYEAALRVARTEMLGLYRERDIIENDFCGVIAGGIGGLPHGGNEDYLIIVYKSGGVTSLQGFLDRNAECLEYMFLLRGGDISFGDQPNILNVKGVKKDTQTPVVLLLDLDTISIISITETEETT